MQYQISRVPSSQTQINSSHIIPPNLPQTYSIIRCQDLDYRVLSRQYSRNYLTAILFCVFWIGVVVQSISLIIVYSLNFNVVVVIGASVLVNLALTLYVLVWRNKLSNAMIFSVINANALLVGILVLLLMNLQLLIIPGLAYAAIQIIVSLFLMQNKGKILLKGLFLAEVILICLKVDGRIDLRWSEVFFGFTIAFAFLITVTIFIAIFSLIRHHCYSQNTFALNNHGLIFLSLFLTGFVSIMSIPLSWSYFNANIIIPTSITIVVALILSAYIWFFRMQISIFLCNSVQAATIQEQKIQIIHDKNTKQLQQTSMKSLFRMSQNWFSQHYDKKTCEKQFQKQEQCIVCMQRQSSIVWLPCGHLTVCQVCCGSIFQTKIVNCILCKMKPTFICRLKIPKALSPEESQGELPKRPKFNIQNMGQCIESSLKKNQFQVLDVFSIRYS